MNLFFIYHNKLGSHTNQPGSLTLKGALSQPKKLSDILKAPQVRKSFPAGKACVSGRIGKLEVGEEPRSLESLTKLEGTERSS